jgi:hypothetical protein
VVSGSSTETQTITLYVRLLDEGTNCWRPTQAELVKEGIYRLLPTTNYNPDDESWEFLPGTLVRCQTLMLSEGSKIVAVAAC